MLQYVLIVIIRHENLSLVENLGKGIFRVSSFF